MKPLLKKLKKCRDPDRFDLVALHKKRLEFREKEAAGNGTGRAVEDDGAIFGGGDAPPPNADDSDRESKRRKVADQDPFGPAL